MLKTIRMNFTYNMLVHIFVSKLLNWLLLVLKMTVLTNICLHVYTSCHLTAKKHSFKTIKLYKEVFLVPWHADTYIIVCYKYFVVIQHVYNNNTLYKNIKFRTKDKSRPLNVWCPLWIDVKFNPRTLFWCIFLCFSSEMPKKYNYGWMNIMNCIDGRWMVLF